MSTPTIYRAEADKAVEVETLARIAAYLKLEFDWKAKTVKPPPELPPEAFAKNGEDVPAAIETLPDSFAPIPEWEIDLRASAWAEVPCAQLDTDNPDQRRVIETGRFRLRIVGNCMEPEYTSGQTVEFRIVVLDREALEIGADYCVCRFDNTATFKRLVKINEDDSYSLAAINQKDFPGVLVVPQQEVCRWARVVHRLNPPPVSKVPRIRMK